MAVSKDFEKQLKRSLEKKIRVQMNKVVREAAKEVMNGLAETGPVWSGEFRDSWIAEGLGNQAKSAQKGAYPYSLWNVPKLPVTLKELRRSNRIQIKNTAEHAAIAMDIKKGVYKYPGFEPIKNKSGYLDRGTRVSGLRGDIETGKGNNRSTAPLDWYPTFKSGGKLQRALSRGVKLAKMPKGEGSK